MHTRRVLIILTIIGICVSSIGCSGNPITVFTPTLTPTIPPDPETIILEYGFRSVCAERNLSSDCKIYQYDRTKNFSDDETNVEIKILDNGGLEFSFFEVGYFPHYDIPLSIVKELYPSDASEAVEEIMKKTVGDGMLIPGANLPTVNVNDYWISCYRDNTYVTITIVK
jgi:hypothetical protein